MAFNILEKIAQELSLSAHHVDKTVQLLDEGNTIPFISRYRKEITGNMDEVQVSLIKNRVEQLRELEKRKEFVIQTIREQGKLTPELEKSITEAETIARVEDLYLPYKPKRKTRATQAKEKGLEPLAQLLFDQPKNLIPELEAQAFVSTEKEVLTTEDALQGARDIIAEWINENAELRASMRHVFARQASLTASVITGKEHEAIKYKDYFDYTEMLKDAPSHRILAIRRGEKEGFLSVDIAPPEEDALELIFKKTIINTSAAADQVKIAGKDAYKRLMKPSIETDMRLDSKTKADKEAIVVFSENLRQLLMAAPFGQKNIMAVDPGFRTGCKVVCLNPQGKLLDYTAIFPHEPQRKVAEAGAVVAALCEKFAIQAIAIGNGTAGRETERFIQSLGLPATIAVIMVNESGASVYSASDVAREEFPDHDVTVRGAVSIGRRLMDPLSELVKIDPKAIGVGQYQHDVDQTELKKGLDEVVESCVNQVGVELNTASKELLAYVSGIGPSLAQNIITYRNTHGAFPNRETLKRVPRLGDKVFEQAAGFLRVKGSNHPLDESAVHPERYALVDKMAKDLNISVQDLIRKPELRKQVNIKQYETASVGLPTLMDIMKELEKPGRDPRENFELFAFSDGVHEISDLKIGMELPGIVTNVTKFGAFVDIGVHQDGLVHISEMADRYISDPAQVVKVQQKVKVRIVDVDIATKRIALSMKSPQAKPASKAAPKTEAPEGDLQSKLAALKNKFK